MKDFLISEITLISCGSKPAGSTIKVSSRMRAKYERIGLIAPRDSAPEAETKGRTKKTTKKNKPQQVKDAPSPEE